MVDPMVQEILCSMMVRLTAETSAGIGSIPRNPDNLRAYQAADAYEAGNAIKTSINGIVLNAVSNMKGTYDKSKAYAAGNVLKAGSDWYALTNEHHGTWKSTYHGNCCGK